MAESRARRVACSPLQQHLRVELGGAGGARAVLLLVVLQQGDRSVLGLGGGVLSVRLLLQGMGLQGWGLAPSEWARARESQGGVRLVVLLGGGV